MRVRRGRFHYYFDSRQKGKLKFFDESKKYGFLLLDEDNTDVFVHLDDMQNAGITVEMLRAFS